MKISVGVGNLATTRDQKRAFEEQGGNESRTRGYKAEEELLSDMTGTVRGVENVGGGGAYNGAGVAGG